MVRRSAMERALQEHDRMAQPFERARSLLVRGRIERRAKQKRLARASIEEARDAFSDLGAPLWTDLAESELARIGGRPPTSHGADRDGTGSGPPRRPGADQSRGRRRSLHEPEHGSSQPQTHLRQARRAARGPSSRVGSRRPLQRPDPFEGVSNVLARGIPPMFAGPSVLSRSQQTRADGRRLP